MTSELVGSTLLIGIVILAGGLALIGLDTETPRPASAHIDYTAVREDPTTNTWTGEAVTIERATAPVLQITTNETTYHVDVQDDIQLLILCPASGGWTLHDDDHTLAWSAMPACHHEDTPSPPLPTEDDAGDDQPEEQAGEEDCEESIDIIVQGDAAGVVWTTCD